METYIGPPETNHTLSLTRDVVIAALSGQGLEVVDANTKPATDVGRARWVLSFKDTTATLAFQEQSDRLVFATLEQSMFDDTSVPSRICSALEALGWEVDEESIG